MENKYYSRLDLPELKLLAKRWANRFPIIKKVVLFRKENPLIGPLLKDDVYLLWPVLNVHYVECILRHVEADDIEREGNEGADADGNIWCMRPALKEEAEYSSILPFESVYRRYERECIDGDYLLEGLGRAYKNPQPNWESEWTILKPWEPEPDDTAVIKESRRVLFEHGRKHLSAQTYLEKSYGSKNIAKPQSRFHMSVSDVNSPDDFPALIPKNLEEQARKWVGNYSNIRISKITLYRYSSEFQEHLNGFVPVQYAVVFDVLENSCKEETIETDCSNLFPNLSIPKLKPLAERWTRHYSHVIQRIVLYPIHLEREPIKYIVSFEVPKIDPDDDDKKLKAEYKSLCTEVACCDDYPWLDEEIEAIYRIHPADFKSQWQFDIGEPENVTYGPRFCVLYDRFAELVRDMENFQTAPPGGIRFKALMGADFKSVYRQVPANFRDEWFLFLKRTNAELPLGVQVDGASWVLFEKDTLDGKLNRLIKDAAPELERIHATIKEEVGFSGKNVNVSPETWQKAALACFDRHKSEFKTLKRSYLENERIFDLASGNEKRDFIGRVLKNLSKDKFGRKGNAQKLYRTYTKLTNQTG